MVKKAGILAMDEGRLHEVDGVVFDDDSYARYLQHCNETPAAPEPDKPAESAEAETESAPSPVFYAEPKHVGWYESSEDAPRVPIMSGAVPPRIEAAPAPAPAYFIAPVQTVEEIRIPVGQTRRIVYGGGSGSGSYVTSSTTSFLTSYRYGSGSGSYFSSGSCIYAVGGYGLELI